MNSDGSLQTRLTNNAANDFAAVFTWENFILFETDRDGNTEVYRMDSDGQNLIDLTNNAANDKVPAASFYRIQ